MAKKMSFEEAMNRLGEIVKRLEEGDVPLEESMRLYEEGMRLGSISRGILKEAEQRIKRLTQDAATDAHESEE
jgi:exodeoxyribonuclease VII small subunit